MTTRMMAYDGEGNEVGMLTLAEAQERVAWDSVEVVPADDRERTTAVEYLREFRATGTAGAWFFAPGDRPDSTDSDVLDEASERSIPNATVIDWTGFPVARK